MCAGQGRSPASYSVADTEGLGVTPGNWCAASQPDDQILDPCILHLLFSRRNPAPPSPGKKR